MAKDRTASRGIPNIWTTMDYVAPRGQCNYKQSIMSPRCPCLRFMLHPLKSASSYECDGCTHHASFHSLENKAEDEVCKRWEQEARDRAEMQQAEANGARPRKRLREIEYTAGDATSSQVRSIEFGMLTPADGDTGSEASSGRGRATARAKGKRGGVGRTTRAKGKVTEVREEVEEFIELD